MTRAQWAVGDFVMNNPPVSGKTPMLVVDLVRGKDVVADPEMAAAVNPIWRQIAKDYPETLFLVAAINYPKSGGVHEHILLGAECRMVKQDAGWMAKNK